MSTLYMVMSYGGMILAVICLVVASILFFQWNIPKIFANLTGRTKRKAMKQIREEGYHVSSRGHKMKDEVVNTEMEHIRIRTTSDGLKSGDNVHNEAGEAETTPLRSEAETTPLYSETSSMFQNYSSRGDSGENTTMVLKSDMASPQASMREQEGEITSVLTQSMGGFEAEEATTLLRATNTEDVIVLPPEEKTKPGKVKEVLNLVVIHTEEVVG